MGGGVGGMGRRDGEEEWGGGWEEGWGGGMGRRGKRDGEG